MKYEYNGNLTEENRIAKVSSDIILEFPELKEKSIILAAMEEPITDNRIGIRFYRLFNIEYLIKDDKKYFNTFNKVKDMIFNLYQESRNKLDDYDKQVVDYLINNFHQYLNDNNHSFPTKGEFTNEYFS